jgi:hypothetical protein
MSMSDAALAVGRRASLWRRRRRGALVSAGRCLSGGAPLPGVSARGADDGTRTRDPHLGKVMLYQLSHVREVSECIGGGVGNRWGTFASA